MQITKVERLVVIPKKRLLELMATLYTAYQHRDKLNYDEECEIMAATKEQLEQSELIWKDRRGKWHLWRSPEEWSAMKLARKLQLRPASRGGARSAQAGRIRKPRAHLLPAAAAGAEDRVPLTRA